MARIKAKPILNRLPIAPVQIPMKNGFRTTPPPTVYDPAAAAFTTQQRYVYANGATLPQGAVSYGGQVPMFPFQQQQFYPGLMQPWPAAPPPGQNFYELSSVFSANGLAPQVSFTAKQQNPRYTNHRNNMRNKRTSNNEQQVSHQQQQQQQQSHSNHRSLHSSSVNAIQQQQQLQQQQHNHHHSSQQQQQQQQPHQKTFQSHAVSNNPIATKQQQLPTILNHGSNNNSINKLIDVNLVKKDTNITQTSNVPQISQLPHTNSATTSSTLSSSLAVHPNQENCDVGGGGGGSGGVGSNTQIVTNLKTTPTDSDETSSHRQTTAGNKDPWIRYRRRRKDDELLNSGGGGGSGGNIISTTNINNNNNRSTNSNNGASSSGQTKPISSASPNQSTQLRDNLSVSGQLTHSVSRTTAQFDLEASAFPPLPGFDNQNQNAQTSNNQILVNYGNKPITASTTTPSLTTIPTATTITNDISDLSIGTTSSVAWGENRLADVVKGTTAAATVNAKSKKDNNSTRSNSASPISFNNNLNNLSTYELSQITPTTPIDAQQQQQQQQSTTIDLLQNSTVVLTPPFSPDTNTNINKINPPVIKYNTTTTTTTADKSTKTEESLLNGPETCAIQELIISPLNISIGTILTTTATCPTTTNVATMTTTTTIPIAVSTSASTMTMSTKSQQKQNSSSKLNNSSSSSKTCATTMSIQSLTQTVTSNSELIQRSISPSQLLPPSVSVNAVAGASAVVISSSSPINTISSDLPLATNTAAAITTTTTTISNDSSVKLSYAQVAQHHKERLLKEKQNSDMLNSQIEKDRHIEKENNKKKDSPTNSRVSSLHGDSRERGGM